MKIEPVKRSQASERFVEWLKDNAARFDDLSRQELPRSIGTREKFSVSAEQHPMSHQTLQVKLNQQ